MTQQPSDEGFALLDALLALAIFGVMTGMFVETVTSTVMARRHAEASRQAVMVAQSRLAVAMELHELSPSGRDGEFAWRAQSSRYPGSENSVGLEKVVVEVTDPASGRIVSRLSSLRLAR